MERKSDMVRRLVAEGDYKKALAIVKTFKLGINKQQKDTMITAYECMVHPRFYISLGINTSQAITDGISVLNELYG